MNRTLFAVLVFVSSAACGRSPSAPSALPAPPVTSPSQASTGTLLLSGIVYSVDATGRRPLAGATVELSESGATWGDFGRPVTDFNGRYVFGSLASRHYLARASKAGYDTSAVVTIGFLIASRTLDLELTAIGTSVGPLTVTSLEPTRGSTGGGTTVRITGSGFRTGVTVTFDGQRRTASLLSSTSVSLDTPAHGAGPVDVIVSNPDGQAVKLTGGYTFAAAQSFDFNGTWVGYALAHPELQASLGTRHSDMDLQFTIQNNALTNVTCGGSVVTLSQVPTVSNGEFSVTAPGVALTGRIVSDTGAIGTINTTNCPTTRWGATKR